MASAVDLDEWRAAGQLIDVDGLDLFVIDRPADVVELAEPLFLIHGFPTSSFDWAHVAPELGAHRRLIAIDLPGFGFSAKPDIHYSVDLWASAALGVLAALGIGRCALATHDLGDTVGGEVLARVLEGSIDLEVTRRILTNGSIYIEMAQLTAGQQLLLSLPDARISVDDLLTPETIAASLDATFAAGHGVAADVTAAMASTVLADEGERLLARTVRYIEERRRNERRFTGAIETHPAPLTVIWGAEDPIAVVAMTDVLLTARPDADRHILEGVGHFPMVEAPDRLSELMLAALG